jgi:hypothetical protein
MSGHVARIVEVRNTYKTLIRKPQGKRLHGKSKRRWEDNIKMKMSYGLDDPGFESRQGLGIFLFSTASRPAIGAHPASYPMGTRDSFPGDKAAGA